MNLPLNIVKIAHAAAMAVSDEELILIDQIVSRVLPMAKLAKTESDRAYWICILALANAAHPVDMVGLYTAPDKEFAADMFGMRNYVDRPTGRYLTDWRPVNSMKVA